jgi:hypothetical protein
MAAKHDFASVFERLRAILAPYAPRLVVVKDEPGDIYLDTATIGANKKPVFFAAAQVKKGYVSFYLMPLYAHPELFDEASSALEARRHGKSCFNFKTITEDDARALEELTRRGFERYEREGLV